MGWRPTSTYVVLGLLERWGPMTPYGLDGAIRRSIGAFWSFPRSQVYAEADRLVRQGLVVQTQEQHGRRRRLLQLSETGAAEVARWRRDAGGPGEAAGTLIHDEGLLRLFFTDDPDVLADLAARQVEVHRARREEYGRLLGSGRVTSGSGAEATLELGLAYETLAVGHWERMARRAVDLGATGLR